MDWARFGRRFKLAFAIASALAVLFMIVLSNVERGGLLILFLVPLLLLVVLCVSVLVAFLSS